MAYENNDKKMESVYSKRIKAGKRRTYFFDVRETRGNDFYLTITESRKRFDSDGYDRHKIFLYKEDFNKFVKGLSEAVDYVKTDLMPDFDFDAFNHDNYDENGNSTYTPNSPTESTQPGDEAPAAPEAETTDNETSNTEAESTIKEEPIPESPTDSHTPEQDIAAEENENKNLDNGADVEVDKW